VGGGKRTITLKGSVTETKGVASQPVLPTPPERGPVTERGRREYDEAMRRRLRVASTDIRGWVDDAGHICEELSCRIDALDAVGERCPELSSQARRL
jgi:hypothetical protein